MYRPDYVYPDNAAKQALFDAKVKPRVLCRWGGNSRVVVLDPALNPEGYTYEQMLNDPTVPPIMQSRFDEYWNTTVARTCDMIERLPDEWGLSVEYHNTYDPAYFGGKVHYLDGQVPTCHPFLTLDDVDEFMRQDYSKPLENPYIKDRLRFRDELIKASADFKYLGRKGKVLHFTLGFDGPLTVAYMLFGEDIFMLLAAEPEKAKKLMMFITQAAIVRNEALNELAGRPKIASDGGLADDAIQLISTKMYEDLILPSHEFWYAHGSKAAAGSGSRGMHCCGDGTRHFKTIAEKLGLSYFDTGFPVDFGWLRSQLGEGVHISGGPPIHMFTGSRPEQLFDYTRDLLQSGILAGRRFGLREGNNMPPQVPLENMRAVYQACLEYGWFEGKNA